MEALSSRVDLSKFAALSHDLICIANTSGYLSWVSPRWSEVLGWSSEELCAKPFIEFVHPDDVAPTLAEVGKLDDGRPTIQFTNRYRHKNGDWVWLEWSSRPTDTKELYAVARDVTARKQQEKRSVRRMQLLEAAEEVGQTGHWQADLVRNTVFWSPEIYRIHGVDPETFTPDLEQGINAYHPDDRDKVSRYVTAAIEKQQPFSFELRIVRPSGEIRLVHSRGYPEIDEQGNCVGMFGVFRDITDDERVRRQEDLEQFAYVASHDLREPVRTIRLFHGLLQETIAEHLADDEPQRYWQYILDATDRIDALVQGLLMYARAGDRVELEDVDLGSVVNEVIADLGASIVERSAEVVVGELPVVRGPRTQLYQVFQNLVSNALKFSGSRPPHIDVRGRREVNGWHIEVIDRGIGFEPEFGERIFSPFRRLHTVAEYPGTGIGLAVVKRILQHCGGQVWADGRLGEGATFHLLFPTQNPT